MKLGIIMSDFRTGSDIIDRLSTEKPGVILVGNGVYHATTKEGGKSSPLLDKPLTFYALTEDLESRGYTAENLDARVKAVTYDDVVDQIFSDYEKIIWI
ncbi:MAG: DsrH/TusB family sulfur metabolism protein [Candidatus Sulfobium sp.]|jgi:sulfur relay protein TusB/DsrH